MNSMLCLYCLLSFELGKVPVLVSDSKNKPSNILLFTLLIMLKYRQKNKMKDIPF